MTDGKTKISSKTTNRVIQTGPAPLTARVLSDSFIGRGGFCRARLNGTGYPVIGMTKGLPYVPYRIRLGPRRRNGLRVGEKQLRVWKTAPFTADLFIPPARWYNQLDLYLFVKYVFYKFVAYYRRFVGTPHI